MVKSLSWRIQLWYGILLALVLLGFTGFVYARMRIHRFREIDTELEGAAQSLIAVLRSVPPIDLDRDSLDLPDRPEWDGLEASHERPPPPPRPGRRHWEWDEPPTGADAANDFEHRPPPPGMFGRPDRGWRSKMELPIGFKYRTGGSHAFFVCWQGEEVLARSNDAPSPQQLYMPASLKEQQPYFYSQRELRTVVIPGPKQTAVAVGRSIDRELGELNRWLALLLSASAVIFVMGTAGGAWLTTRALAPVEAMSADAAKISVDNLSQRIDVAEVDSELAELANTLNHTFARLEHAFQRQAAFTADASHELRTPLTIILGHLQRILSRENLSDDSKEALQASFRAAKRMQSLIEQLLLLARADAGKLIAAEETCDFRGVIEEVVQLLSPMAAAKQVDVQTDLAAVEVGGDAALISRIVTNLVSNAIQHHKGNGKVMVRLQLEGTVAVLKVIDDGPGISAEAQPQLFQRFYRADKARSRTSGGSGLGLAITYAVVEAHGGEISCDSVPGKGTTFTVRLPHASAGEA